MFDKIDLFNLTQSMARHAVARQAAVAENVANADTPGYLAKDVANFDATYQRNDQAMRRTRPGHLGAADGDAALRPTVTRSAMSPNGNAVSLEAEMVKSVAAKREHDLALTVYKTSLGILRTSLGRR